MRRFLCFWRWAIQPEESGFLPEYKPVGKIHKAASQGDVDKIESLLLLRKCHVSQADKKMRTALHYACAYGHPEVARFLIRMRCSINACDSDQRTPLIKASQHQHEECVKILLENGANPNVADATRNTALHYAVYNNRPAIVTTLMEHNVDLEAKAKDGFTPLIAAVANNNLQIAELLLRKAKVNTMDELGRTALSHAILQKSKDMVNLLLDNGADHSLVDAYGFALSYYISILDLGKSTNKPSPSDSLPTPKKVDAEPFVLKKSSNGLSRFWFGHPITCTETLLLANGYELGKSVPPKVKQQKITVKEDLTALNKLARDIEEEIINHPRPTRKCRGSLFANRGQLSDPEEENKSQVEELDEEKKIHLSNCIRKWRLKLEKKRRERKNRQDFNLDESIDWYSAFRLSETSICSGSSITSEPEAHSGKTKDKLAPHPVPQTGNKQQMAELPIKDETNLHEDEELERSVSDSDKKKPEACEESKPEPGSTGYTRKPRVSATRGRPRHLPFEVTTTGK